MSRSGPAVDRPQPSAGAAQLRDFSAFRAEVSSSFVPLRVSAEAHAPFRGSIRAAEADSVGFKEVSAGAHLVERTPELIALGGDDYYKVSLILAGSSLLVQDRREVLLRPGELAVYDTAKPYSLVFDREFRNLVVMLPKRLLELPAPLMDRLLATRLTDPRGLSGAVVPFLAQLPAHFDQLSGSVGAQLARASVGLLRSLFVSRLDLADDAGDPHHALRDKIREYIDAHLGSPALSPGQIAAAHFISTRHLHGLFRELDTTVSTWIRVRRLERCRLDLIDPVFAGRPVAAIAAHWGFGDAAHFSRVYKHHFGRSPSAERAAAR